MASQSLYSDDVQHNLISGSRAGKRARPLDETSTSRRQCRVLPERCGLCNSAHRLRKEVLDHYPASQAVQHRLLCTSDHGVPQRRERFFLVAILAEFVREGVSLESIFPKPLRYKAGQCQEAQQVLRRVPRESFNPLCQARTIGFLHKRAVRGDPILDESKQSTTFKRNLEHARGQDTV